MFEFVQRPIKMSKNLLEATTREALSHAKALHLYPLGHWSWSEKAVLHPAHAVNPRPILLVHGVIHNRSAFFSLRKEMENWGWINVFSLNYSTWHGSLTGMIEDLARRVEQIQKETGSPSVDIVAHSLGGLIARYFMSIGAGRGKVSQLVTLGTAHKGTNLSSVLRVFLGGSLYRDLKKKSYFISSLNQVVLPRNSRIVSIYTKQDRVVWPYKNCLVDDTIGESFENVEVHSAGHMSLLYDEKVFEVVHKELLSDSRRTETAPIIKEVESPINS